ncbi:MAG: hypothetical protein ACREFB_01555 [Stellaceae bacterium]
MRLSIAIILAALTALPAFAQEPPRPSTEPDKPAGKVCMEVYRPVCAVKEGHAKTYSNKCFAKVDGATDITPGHCSPGK